MAISAIDTAATVTVSQGGQKGEPGTNGVNGEGFSAVRKSLIDNPLCWLYKKNNLVNRIDYLLTVTRAVGGSYTDIYGVVTAADPDEPREEANGWLITSDEDHKFNVLNNIPLLDNGFSCVLELGYYLGGAISQSIISIPASAGQLFTIGTDSIGNFTATLKADDTITYEAVTTIPSAISANTTLIAIFDGITLDLYINGALSGTIAIPTGTPDAMALTDATLGGNYTINVRGLRFYDIALNSDEITYLS